jgi:hypothetical protein
LNPVDKRFSSLEKKIKLEKQSSYDLLMLIDELKKIDNKTFKQVISIPNISKELIINVILNSFILEK